MRLTVLGDKITFDGPVSTPSSDQTSSKLHWNSIILNPGYKYLVADVKNFYFKNQLSKHYYYKITLRLIHQDIIDNYNLMDNQINGYIYVRV